MAVFCECRVCVFWRYLYVPFFVRHIDVDISRFFPGAKVNRGVFEEAAIFKHKDIFHRVWCEIRHSETKKKGKKDALKHRCRCGGLWYSSHQRRGWFPWLSCEKKAAS